MLISGCVKNKIGGTLDENLLQSRLVFCVTDQRDDVDVGPIVREPLPDRVKRKFACIEEQEASHGKMHKLPAQFTADGSARAGNEDASPGNHRTDIIRIDMNRLTPQQVPDVDR